MKFKVKHPNTNAIIRIFGLGFTKKLKCATKLGLVKESLYFYKGDFKDIDRERIDEFIRNSRPNGERLKKTLFEKQFDFARLRTLRAFKFLNNLPINGQRTKTNAKTSKRRTLSREFFALKNSFRKFYVEKAKTKQKSKRGKIK